ncbi:MAG: glycerophosphodiester phosphodiesterase family protein, partial [Oscillospiraceae bacterium]
VWETDYSTVQALDAGSFFSSTFAGERVPTLEEMLNAAKGRIRLMIELKSTGHEHNLVEQTIQLIQAAGMETECVIASMDAALLERSKQLAPEIETVYITSLAFSEQFDLDYVDGYSVETSFLTPEMVTQIQYRQKKIYAWTANTESNIKKIIRMGADGLVTDNPRLANFFLKFFSKNYLIDGLADLLYP